MKNKSHSRPGNSSRRQFLKTSLTYTGASFFIPRFAVGQAAGNSNSRLRVAVVGCGVWGRNHLRRQEVDFVAICDVDDRSMAEAKSEHAHVAGAREFNDFRVMFDKMGDDLDAVVVATPDHNHFAVSLLALQHGKHVYTEKPLTYSIWQARKLAEVAASKPHIKTIMGNQGHTSDGIRQMREWHEAGILGQVTEVHSWFPGPNWNSRAFRKPNAFPPPGMPVPSELNWDLWIGPAEMVPFNTVYLNGPWRGFWDFGTGMLGDWFPHIADGPVWILDLYAPTVIEAEKIVGPNPGMCPDGSTIRYDFPERNGKAACTLRWSDGGERPETPADWGWTDQVNAQGRPVGPRAGSFWTGENGMFYLDERSNNPRASSREKMIELRSSGALPDPWIPRVARGGPLMEWVRAIQGDGPNPGSDFAYASKLSEIACLGVLAQRFGGRIEWDAKNMRVTNRPELNHYVNPPVRSGWEFSSAI